MENNPKQAMVYVQHGSPWICTCCPTCGKAVYGSQNFCPECGQALAFDDARMVREGQRGIKLPPTWQRLILNDAVKAEYLKRQLERLEAECQAEENPILRIMRDAYIKAVLESKG